MAPPSLGTIHDGLENMPILPLLTRDTKSPEQVNPARAFSAHQKYQLYALGISISSVSVFAELITIYWFLRMKRNFRHHLIMLLIFANLTRQLWVLIYASASIEGTETDTYSNLCDASGFFHQFGTEAADFAILMIAIHAALCIFSKGAPYKGEGGIYRYRYLVYVLWTIFAVLGSTLAFTNPGYGYISIPPFCYLPIFPLWYRLALSWVPRYIILLTIIAIYIAIYVYVRKKFNSFSLKQPAENSENSSKTGETGSIDGTEDIHELLETAAARSANGSAPRHNACLENGHGSLNAPNPNRLNLRDTKESLEKLEREKNKRPFTQYFDPTNPSQGRQRRASSPIALPHPPGFHIPKPQSVAVRQDSIGGSSINARRVSDLGPNISQVLGSVAQPTKSDGDMHPKNSSSKRNFSRSESVTSCPQITANGTKTQDENAAARNMRRMRRNIRRQLQLLFVYPIVYVIVWTLPFVGSIMQLSKYSLSHPEFVFSCFLVVSLLIQGAVDCLVFSWREKPWRHISNSDGTFLGSFLFWKTFAENPALEGIPRRSGSLRKRTRRFQNGVGFRTSRRTSLGLPTFYDDEVGLSAAEMEAQSEAAYARRERERVENEKKRKARLSTRDGQARLGGEAHVNDTASPKNSASGSSIPRSENEQREWWSGILEEN